MIVTSHRKFCQENKAVKEVKNDIWKILFTTLINRSAIMDINNSHTVTCYLLFLKHTKDYH